MRASSSVCCGRDRACSRLSWLSRSSRPRCCSAEIWAGGCRCGIGSGPGVDARALIDGRHEAGAPVAWPIVDRGGIVLHHHEGGQVLVLGAQAIGDPAAQRRPAAQDRAGVHLADAVGMVQPVGPAGANDGDVVDALGGVRQPIRHPDAALAMPGPAPRRRQDRRVKLTHGRDDGAKAARECVGPPAD